MTWVKLSDDFADDCARARLSDAAFRMHTEALLWVMRRETGGLVDNLDIRRFAETPNSHEAISELLDVGFWEHHGRGYRVLHHMEHQPEPEVISARRMMAAERKRRERKRKAGIGESRRDSARDNPRDRARDPGRVGTGREDRTEVRREEDREW